MSTTKKSGVFGSISDLNQNEDDIAAFKEREETTNPDLVTQTIGGVVFEVPKRYQVKALIGSGAYAKVCSAKDTVTDEWVAIKKNVDVFPELTEEELKDEKKVRRTQIIQKRIMRELKILRHLDHENIIGLRDVVVPRDFQSFNDVYFVSELMETDLRALIVGKAELTETHVSYLVYQILVAMKYIHSANILHRDLKPDNILLNKNCELKICDFGLSRGMDFEDDARMSTHYVQTRWYRAPELLLQHDVVTKQIDIWSVGCIFAELILRKPFFRGANHIDQLNKILAILGTPADEDIKGSANAKAYLKKLPKRPRKNLADFFPNTNPMAIDLMERMLTFNPDHRITAEQALEHPYLVQFHEVEAEPTCPIFNFEFEEEAKTKGVKRVLYNEIIDFHQTKRAENSTLTSPAAESPNTQARKGKSATKSPIADLITRFFKSSSTGTGDDPMQLCGNSNNNVSATSSSTTVTMINGVPTSVSVGREKTGPA